MDKYNKRRIIAVYAALPLAAIFLLIDKYIYDGAIFTNIIWKLMAFISSFGFIEFGIIIYEKYESYKAKKKV